MNQNSQHKPRHLPRLRRAAGWLWLPLLWLVLVWLDLGNRYMYPMDGMHPWNDPTAMFFTMLWSLLLTGIVYIMPTVGRRILMVLFVTVQCIWCLVFGAMYTIFGSVFSFADLAYAGDSAKFFLSLIHI